MTGTGWRPPTLAVRRTPPGDRPITTLAEVAGWLGPSWDEAAVSTAYQAAEAYVSKRTRWAAEEPPADLAQAVTFQTARYLARRNSPDGMVGMSEFGPARITVTDKDVADLIAPWRPVVFG